jgi:hypothetical protein
VSVYRKPFLYAQHYASRIEWQPQPNWAIDATLAAWEWTTYAAGITVGIPCTTAQWAWQGRVATVTVAGDVEIACGVAQWAWRGYRATQSSSREIACAPASWAWTVYSSEVASVPLTIPVGGIRASVSQRGMNTTFSQKRITARVA